ncbi:MAG TPA: hypothetical protein PKW32_17840, partial [Verrucomicrobiota bacterium]|nr:hypothetical protein [Verrucomicrobiota bacterium]
MQEINKPREGGKQSMRSGHRLGHGLTTERWLAGWNCRRWLGLLVFIVGLGSWNEAAGDSRGYVKVKFRLEAAFSGDPGDYGYLSAQINDVSAIIGITLTNQGGTSGFTNDWTTVRVPLSSSDETNDVPILATYQGTWRTSRIYIEPPSCYAIYPEYLGGYFLGFDTGSSTNYFHVCGDSGALFITIDGVPKGEIPRLAADGVSRITARLSGASST